MTTPSDFDLFLERFVGNYTGPRIAAVISGGGVSLSGLALIPGASGVLYEVSCPYDTLATERTIYLGNSMTRYFHKKAVSGDAAWEMARAFENLHPYNTKVIAITSALTTTRFRRGENQAFICIGDGNINSVYNLKLTKLPEEIYTDPIASWKTHIIRKRKEEDRLVAEVALKLATGFEAKETLPVMFENKSLVML